VRRNVDSIEAANWIMESVLADVKAHNGAFRVSADRLANLVELVADGELSRLAGKEVFAAAAETDQEPRFVAERLGLLQVGDAQQVARWVADVIASYPAQVDRFRGGESKLLDFFMGRAMQLSRGRADPRELRSMLESRLADPGS
jgi:aspartyl-tRNA(Asn)/glutamyl-tRNA(Gln) amidotransferase subunit B